MTNDRYVHQLTGCSPTPLASYLKALGILRLVAEQADSKVQGWWSGDVFHLRTKLDRGALSKFFLDDYAPTPLVGPWGARSGFYMEQSEATSRAALTEIAGCTLQRLSKFRHAIESMRAVLLANGFEMKPSETDDKGKWRLKLLCRSTMPDDVIQWMDAAFVLMETVPKFPPILGTGGNEGSGSYMSGFSQQIASVIIHREFDHTLLTALFGGANDRSFVKQTPGHFMPDATGGPNASSDSVGEIATNPWDYILLLEGVVVFAGACVKKLESHNDYSLAFPFSVNQCGVGYASASSTDENSSRGETWLPLWSRPSQFSEISATFAEGRSETCGRRAKTAVDFCRAIATLGTDRGIGAFQRYGFLTRNGDRSTFAVSLGQVRVTEQPQAMLLAEIDSWLDSFRRAASSKNAPSRAQRALRRLESAILHLCQKEGPTRLQAVLMALGEAEATLCVSSEWRTESFQRPVPLLSPRWFVESDDSTDEFGLSTSLAAMLSASVGDFRQHIEPIEIKGNPTDPKTRWINWTDSSAARCNVVWKAGSLEDNMIAVLRRRITEAIRQDERSKDGTLVFPGHSFCSASLGNVGSFLRRRTDDERIASLVRGLVLIDWDRVHQVRSNEDLPRRSSEPLPDATFTILKLCHTSWPVRDFFVRLDPSISTRCIAGNASEAIRLAATRLRSSGLLPRFQVASRDSKSIRRMAAALLFPLDRADIKFLADHALETPPENTEVMLPL